ncbi:MAG: hypothetical protein HUK14_03585 [Muribaculaceae bacterium]|nr:hypothetical protein [Muribaculaceae bacterium]
MKKSILSIGFASLALVITAFSANGSTVGSGNSNESAASKIECQVSGDIDVKNIQPKQKGKVTFNRFPATLAEFKEVKAELDKTPQGAVALQLMAAELYRRDHAAGEEAFKLTNTTTNVNTVVRGFKGVFDGYEGRRNTPYQVAAFLEGANWENGYTPKEPYTVVVEVSANGASYSSTYQTDVISFLIYTQGSDSGKRLGVSVLSTAKPGEPSGYIVSNCPPLYFQIREISFTVPFPGLK